MRPLVAIILGVAACGGARPASGPIDNHGTGDVAASTCPTDTPPFAAPPPTATDDDCAHGPSPALLDAPADAPTCHQFRATGPTSAVEAVTLPGGERVWLAQGGCVHATIEIHGQVATPSGHRDRRSRAAALLRALDRYGVADDGWFAHMGDDVAAAVGGDDGTAVPIGAGDWTAAIDGAADGPLHITLDFPL